MADDIKPSVQGRTQTPSGQTPVVPSGPSPLTPDIKIPSNLLTGEVKSPTTPPPTKPPIPISPTLPRQFTMPGIPPISVPAPSSTRPLFIPPKSEVGLKPSVPTLPLAAPSGQPPTVFKSSIRTMQDDLAVLKKGQTPAGFKIEKESEKEIKSTPEVAGPKVIPPPSPISHVELGKLEKAKPLPSATSQPLTMPRIPPLAVPPLGLVKPTISISSADGILGRFKSRSDSRRIIIYTAVGIVGFVISAFLIPYLASSPTESITPTPSSTFTSTPTASPISIEGLFSIVDTVGISLGPDFTTRFIDSVITDPLLSSREPGIYKITSVDGTKRYSFTEFVNGMPVEIPNELKSLVDDSNFLLTLMSKSDNLLSFGFIIKLRNPNIVNEAVAVLQNWENTMKQALANLLQFEQTQASSVGFLDNTYKGTAIRYINFPEPNLTIDYSVVMAKNGESYLVMVNSREHIYGIIDKLR